MEPVLSHRPKRETPVPSGDSLSGIDFAADAACSAHIAPATVDNKTDVQTHSLGSTRVYRTERTGMHSHRDFQHQPNHPRSSRVEHRQCFGVRARRVVSDAVRRRSGDRPDRRCAVHDRDAALVFSRVVRADIAGAAVHSDPFGAGWVRRDTASTTAQYFSVLALLWSASIGGIVAFIVTAARIDRSTDNDGGWLKLRRYA